MTQVPPTIIHFKLKQCALCIGVLYIRNEYWTCGSQFMHARIYSYICSVLHGAQKSYHMVRENLCHGCARADARSLFVRLFGSFPTLLHLGRLESDHRKLDYRTHSSIYHTV